jgi:hypothetical protein
VKVRVCVSVIERAKMKKSIFGISLLIRHPAVHFLSLLDIKNEKKLPSSSSSNYVGHFV